jgi:ABC-type sugar transport system ATPase subunit
MARVNLRYLSLRKFLRCALSAHGHLQQHGVRPSIGEEEKEFHFGNRKTNRKGARSRPHAGSQTKREIVFGIRPEHITNEPKEGSSVPLTLTVDIAEPMGSESLVYLKAGTGNLIARIHGEHLFHLGEQVTAQLDLEKVSLFDAETEKVIR